MEAYRLILRISSINQRLYVRYKHRTRYKLRIYINNNQSNQKVPGGVHRRAEIRVVNRAITTGQPSNLTLNNSNSPLKKDIKRRAVLFWASQNKVDSCHRALVRLPRVFFMISSRRAARYFTGNPIARDCSSNAYLNDRALTSHGNVERHRQRDS